MSESKELEDTLEVPCKNDPQFNPCFALYPQFEQHDEESGAVYCGVCRKLLRNAFGVDEETWDEEDESDEGNEFVRRVGFDDLIGEDRRIHEYKEFIKELAEKINEVDPELSLYIIDYNNLDVIVQRIRDLEEAGEPHFSSGWRGPKVIAVATFLRGKPISEEIYNLVSFKQKRVETMLDRLKEIYQPDKGSKEITAMRNLFPKLNIPQTVLDYAVEEYETIRPTNSQSNDVAKAAAWLFLIAEKTHTKLQKRDLWLAGAPKVATNKAIISYRNNLQKLKGQIEDVDDTDDTNME